MVSTLLGRDLDFKVFVFVLRVWVLRCDRIVWESADRHVHPEVDRMGNRQ